MKIGNRGRVQERIPYFLFLVSISWSYALCPKPSVGEVGAQAGVHALAPLGQADDFEPVHVLVHLLLADRLQLLPALVVVVLAAAEQHAERLRDIALIGDAGLRD